MGGGRLATGSGGASLVCDGTEREVVVRVLADGDFAFKKGEAVAQGSASVCDFFCAFVPFSGTVRVRK